MRAAILLDAEAPCSWLAYDPGSFADGPRACPLSCAALGPCRSDGMSTVARFCNVSLTPTVLERGITCICGVYLCCYATEVLTLSWSKTLIVLVVLILVVVVVVILVVVAVVVAVVAAVVVAIMGNSYSINRNSRQCVAWSSPKKKYMVYRVN